MTNAKNARFKKIPPEKSAKNVGFWKILRMYFSFRNKNAVHILSLTLVQARLRFLW